jgi:hypothetical protein
MWINQVIKVKWDDKDETLVLVPGKKSLQGVPSLFLWSVYKKEVIRTWRWPSATSGENPFLKAPTLILILKFSAPELWENEILLSKLWI